MMTNSFKRFLHHHRLVKLTQLEQGMSCRVVRLENIVIDKCAIAKSSTPKVHAYL